MQCLVRIFVRICCSPVVHSYADMRVARFRMQLLYAWLVYFTDDWYNPVRMWSAHAHSGYIDSVSKAIYNLLTLKNRGCKALFFFFHVRLHDHKFSLISTANACAEHGSRFDVRSIFIVDHENVFLTGRTWFTCPIDEKVSRRSFL
jgi:hypothetical protein